MASDGSTDGNLASVVVTVDEASCAGDCNGDGAVAVDELVRAVDVALGIAALERCPASDTSADDAVTIDEVLRAVRAALEGCGD